jgi:trehalose 6-phosphate synthase/phosphatase
MVHEVVGRINGQYGTLTHVPIYHLDRWVLQPQIHTG